MSVRLLLVACLALAYVPCSANGQCIPKPDSARQDFFSSVENLQAQAVNVGSAGIELSLEERATASLRLFGIMLEAQIP
jgi:hypothetical protein